MTIPNPKGSPMNTNGSRAASDSLANRVTMACVAAGYDIEKTRIKNKVAPACEVVAAIECGLTDTGMGHTASRRYIQRNLLSRPGQSRNWRSWKTLEFYLAFVQELKIVAQTGVDPKRDDAAVWAMQKVEHPSEKVEHPSQKVEHHFSKGGAPSNGHGYAESDTGHGQKKAKSGANNLSTYNKDTEGIYKSSIYRKDSCSTFSFDVAEEIVGALFRNKMVDELPTDPEHVAQEALSWYRSAVSNFEHKQNREAGCWPREIIVMAGDPDGLVAKHDTREQSNSEERPESLEEREAKLQAPVRQ